MSGRLLINRTGMNKAELDALVKTKLEEWDEYQKHPTDKNFRKFQKSMKSAPKQGDKQ
jgi:hypothetical protein